MTRLPRYLLPLVAVVLAWSCGNDNDLVIEPVYRYDIVTYRGNEGATATFELVPRDDNAAPVTLLGTVDAGKRNVGERVLLRYAWDNPADASPTRRVTVYNCQSIISDSLRYNRLPLDRYDTHPVRLRSLWRTGNFVNLHCQVEMTGESRRFFLLMDSATWHSDTVQCHLVHDLLGAGQTLFWRECYASFFVGNVWQLPTCRVLRVWINDEVFPHIKFRDFIKPNIN